MNKKHHISGDFLKNPELKDELGKLRGLVVDNANKIKLSDRFQVTPDESKPRMWIKDTQTGIEVEVPIYAYREVRSVLSKLFPNENRNSNR